MSAYFSAHRPSFCQNEYKALVNKFWLTFFSSVFISRKIKGWPIWYLVILKRAPNFVKIGNSISGMINWYHDVICGRFLFHNFWFMILRFWCKIHLSIIFGSSEMEGLHLWVSYIDFLSNFFYDKMDWRLFHFYLTICNKQYVIDRIMNADFKASYLDFLR